PSARASDETHVVIIMTTTELVKKASGDAVVADLSRHFQQRELADRNPRILEGNRSSTAILRAESAVPRTKRRCILRPSGPASRHLKHQTSGPPLRRSTVTLPSCIPSPFAGRLKTGGIC